MNMPLGLAPIVSLLAGILILVVPRLLNYIVAIYLIVIELLAVSAPELSILSDLARLPRLCRGRSPY